jgi:YaiO family outer membrane protein
MPTRSTRSVLAVLATALAVPALLPGAARAQQGTWVAQLDFQGLSVSGSQDWFELRQGVSRLWSRGDRAGGALVETDRFGRWDQSLELQGTLHPRDRLYVSLQGRWTPDARILERYMLHATVSRPSGHFVPALGYEIKDYPQGPVHQLSPRLDWYGGRWFLRGEARFTRNTFGTINLAAIARAQAGLAPDWQAWVGVAVGNEDFLVGPPGNQSVRTLRTRSAYAGAQWTGLPGWTVRIDVVGVHSEPRLSRAGASLSLSRSF